MLNAVGAPLVLGDLAEDGGALVEKLIHDPVLRRLLQILKGMLEHER